LIEEKRNLPAARRRIKVALVASLSRLGGRLPVCHPFQRVGRCETMQCAQPASAGLLVKSLDELLEMVETARKAGWKRAADNK